MDIPQISILSDDEMNTLHANLQKLDSHNNSQPKRIDVSDDLEAEQHEICHNLGLKEYLNILNGTYPFQRVIFPKIRDLLLSEQWVSISMSQEEIRKLRFIQDYFVSIMSFVLDQVLYIKKVEIVKRGLVLSNPLPPISRIELNSHSQMAEIPRRKLIVSWIYDQLISFEQFMKQIPSVSDESVHLPSIRFTEMHQRNHLCQLLLSFLDEVKSSLHVIHSLQNSPDSLLLSSIDCSIDLVLLLFQGSICATLLHPVLFSLLESNSQSFTPPLLPPIPKIVTPKSPTEAACHRSGFVDQVRSILESMYLYTESNSDDVVSSPQGIEVLQHQLHHLSAVLNQALPKQQPNSTPSEEPAEEVEKVKSVVSKPEETEQAEGEDGKLYVYQGTANGKAESDVSYSELYPHFEYDHRLLLHELQSSYTQRTRNQQIVVIGEVANESEIVESPSPPAVQQVSFFSLLRPRQEEEVIECVVCAKQKSKA